MKKIDHLALSRFLIEVCDNRELRKHRLAFLLGSVEPDINWFTYLRGLRKGKKFHGHNAENSAGHLTRVMFRLLRVDLESSWTYFRLGSILHYIADSFTAVHNSILDVSVDEHLRYENRLHVKLEEEMRRGVRLEDIILPYSTMCYLKETHKAYSEMQPSEENDSRFIVSTCLTVLLCALRYCQRKAEPATQVFSYQVV